MPRNISYVTIYSPTDIHKWSGCGYFIAKSLKEEGNNLDFVGDLEYKTNLILKIKKKINEFQGKKLVINREPRVVRQFTKQINKRISPRSEVIFSPGSIPISLLETNKPKVFYTDATFAGMLNFYESYSGLSPQTIKHGHYLEKKALESATMAIYSSEWAAKTAIEHYNINPEKIKVIPFGANLTEERKYIDLESIINAKDNKEIHLLFVGVEWKRKGGDKAVEVTRCLRERGIQAKLHIAGIKNLPYENLPPYIYNHGFISKSTSEGILKLNNLYNKCHFLLVPSIAEAFGIVFAEANSFGIPAITTNIGGIPSVVKDDVNGKMFSLEDNADKYADYIQSVFFNRKRYKELCFSSFNEFEQRLNWKVTGKLLSDFIGSI